MTPWRTQLLKNQILHEYLPAGSKEYERYLFDDEFHHRVYHGAYVIASLIGWLRVSH